MGKKRILYIWAMGMGDSILSIPFLIDLKKKGHNIVLLKYHPRYFWKKLFYSMDDITTFLEKNNLFDEILYIPYNKLRLLSFIIKNIFRFDVVYIPVKTIFTYLWAILFGKKRKFMFRNINDIKYYTGLVQWMLHKKDITSLFSYRKNLHIPQDRSYRKSFGIHWNFVTIFPSIFERSIDASEWQKVISFLVRRKVTIVIVWGNRESRLNEDLSLYDNNYLINLCWKTNFTQILNILSDSEVNISANGGIMRLWHLLNRNNISFHNTSWFITEPPVDNIYSFNIRKYIYPRCKPCEPKTYRFDWKNGIPCCVFAWTEKEGECRKSITWEDIIYYIKKII